VDIFDEGGVLLVIAELPGVAQEDVHVKVDDDLLRIATRTRGRRYAKEMYLPCPTDTVESILTNGVLQIRLHKAPVEQ